MAARKYSALESITEQQRLQLLGLLVLAKHHMRIVDQCEKAMAELVQEIGHDGQLSAGGGHVGDAIWHEGEPDIDDLMRKLGLVVRIVESANRGE